MNSWVFRGRVEAAGLWIAPPVGSAKRRVLALWHRGAVVYRAPGGYVLCFAQARAVVCEAQPGAVLVRRGAALVSAPVTGDHAGLVLVRGGAVEPLALEREIDPSQWLDVSGFEALAVEPLGAVRRAPVMAPAPRAARRVLAVPEASAAQQAFVAGEAPAEAPARWRQVVSTLLSWLATRFAVAAARDHAASSERPPRPAPEAPAPAAPAGRWRRWLARLLSGLGVLEMLGRRQADYLRRMIDMFERDDFDQALRHAIPLSSLPGGPPKPPALGVPTPREDVRLRPGPRGEAQTSIGFSSEVFEDVRALYRRAVQRLEQAGRIEEAAFVLLELLDEPYDAVTLLERHRLYAVAAELTEARGMIPGLAVRLWFLAGDRQRATMVARRAGAFADAVERLERAGDGAAAAALRAIWADTLASAGELAAAVDAVWPLPEGRALARRWIDLGIQAGGAARGALLHKKLLLDPGATPEVREALALFDDSTDAHRVRSAFARALAAEPVSPEAQRLGREVSRALWADAADHGGDRTVAERLDQSCGGASYRADRPTWPNPLAVEPIDLHIGVTDRGLSSLRDAVRLPGGRYLCALGELGMRLLDADGATLTTFQHPADELCLAHNGQRAIAIATRGNVRRLTRVDLTRRRAEPWCDARIERWAPSFDGDVWYVAVRDDVVAIDALDTAWSGVWRAVGVGQASAIAASAEELQLIADGEQRGYRQRTGQLALVSHLELPEREGMQVALDARGNVVTAHPEGDQLVVERAARNVTSARLHAGVTHHFTLSLEGGVALACARQGGSAVWLLDDDLGPRALVQLDGARQPFAHPSAAGFAIGDERGHLLGFDARGRLERELRI